MVASGSTGHHCINHILIDNMGRFEGQCAMCGTDGRYCSKSRITRLVSHGLGGLMGDGLSPLSASDAVLADYMRSMLILWYAKISLIIITCMAPRGQAMDET